MKKEPLPRILDAVSFYKYLFSFLMAVCLFALPVLKPRPPLMESEFLDVFVRCMLWLYFVFAYRSVSTALTNQIKGVKNLPFEMHRGLSTLLRFVVSSIGLGLLICFLTYWALLTFAPWLTKQVVAFIASLNGLIYAILAFSRYFWLPESE